MLERRATPARARAIGIAAARELFEETGLVLGERRGEAVAADLGISDKTLYRHRANLMEKLGARTRGDLLRIVRERGLLAGDLLDALAAVANA